LEETARDYGCQTYENYSDMLDKEQLDAVYVYADNALGAELTTMAAERGLHVMTEKPLAATLAQAEQMTIAAAKAGVVLMVNWPFAWWKHLQHAIKLAKDGAIGDLFQVRYRSAHNGPKELGCRPSFYNWLYDRDKNGAGALMDYCCYGTALCREVLGQPTRITAVAARLQKDYIDVDDNAIILMTYHHAIGIAEASWTQIDDITNYVPHFYGTQGTMIVQKNGDLLLANLENRMGKVIEVPELPAEQRTASDYFLTRIINEQPVEGMCNANISRDAQEILEAGLISAQIGAEVSLPLKTALGE
jgi:predicted dehydrogenase